MAFWVYVVGSRQQPPPVGARSWRVRTLSSTKCRRRSTLALTTCPANTPPDARPARPSVAASRARAVRTERDRVDRRDLAGVAGEARDLVVSDDPADACHHGRRQHNEGPRRLPATLRGDRALSASVGCAPGAGSGWRAAGGPTDQGIVGGRNRDRPATGQASTRIRYPAGRTTRSALSGSQTGQAFKSAITAVI